MFLLNWKFPNFAFDGKNQTNNNMNRTIFNCENYNVEQITTIAQVKDFTKYLINDLRVNINPDTDFSDYVESSTGKPTFNSKEIERGNQLMADSIKVCEANNTDIYDLMSGYLFATV